MTIHLGMNPEDRGVGLKRHLPKRIRKELGLGRIALGHNFMMLGREKKCYSKPQDQALVVEFHSPNSALSTLKVGSY